MANKYYDNTAALQVIGCIFNNPNILNNEEKYSFLEEDFLGEHRLLFGVLYKIHELGGENPEMNTISDFLETRPKYKAKFYSSKCDELLARIVNEALEDAFDYYYGRLKKMTLLRAFSDIMDLSSFYDVDNILDTEKKQRQEEWLDNTSLQTMAQTILSSVEEIVNTYANNVEYEAKEIGEGIFSLIDRLEENPEAGIPLYGPLVNTVTRGARLKKLYLRSAPTGIGKAIPNYTLIPTPNGWTKVEDIKIGDYLFDQSGKPTKVLNVYPQKEKKEVWKVKFADGRIAECCEEHLWEYYINEDKKVNSLKNIYNEFIDNSELKFYIRLNKKVEYGEKVFDMPPEKIGERIGAYDFLIPDNYLQSSVSQRYKILTGIFKAKKPSLTKDDNIIFSVFNRHLADDVLELCRSLGFVASYKELDKQEFLIIISCDDAKKILICNSDFTVSTVRDNNINNPCDMIQIVDIKPTHLKTDMTCFTVDNDDQLFLMNDYIVTHNTRTLVADACNFACDRLYHKDYGWINNSLKEPTLYIATEQELEEIQTMALAFVSNVNEENILNGTYAPGEKERVLEAARILSESTLYVQELPDFSLQDVENLIKKYIREKDIKYVVHDYIHTSLKILEEISKRSGGVKLREDNVLFMLSTKLKDICNKYGVFIITSTQLNSDYTVSKKPDQNLLRGAKSIADKIDVGMIMLPVTNEDLISLEDVLGEDGFDIPTIKISVYKNRRGRYKDILLWCKDDLGTCRVEPMFATNYNYNLIKIEDVEIKIEGAF